MPPPHDSDLTLAQAELLGRVLVPLVKDALAPEFDRLRADLAAGLALHRTSTAQELSELRARVAALEASKAKAMAGWGLLCVLATLFFNWAARKLGLM